MTTGKGNMNSFPSDEEILADHDYVNDSLVQFTDHEICWDLELRGGVGETILHLCYLHSTLIHLEIARLLLDMHPKLALDVYEGDEYYGN